VGCATGEEVYTLTMLLLEHAATLPEPPQIQLFASDLGKGALDFARDGIYPEAIAANVSEERLDRFFVKENSHYRVREHNIRLLRHIMTTLRPPAVVNFGLIAAIQSHIEDFRQRQPAIRVELVMPEEIPMLSEEVVLGVYRICQQAIYNIVQHAQADQIWVRFYSQDNLLSLEVEDNGIGFTMPANLVELPRRKHLGVVGMTERARAIGGELTVDSAPGQGTRVRMTLSLSQA
jgi:signal transduction histidine kinase